MVAFSVYFGFNMNEKPKIEFLPDIEDYLESVSTPVQISELDDIIDHVAAKTGLDIEQASIVVQSIFQEIRNAMLRGESVTFRGLGEFYISSPKNGNKIRIFPKFKPHKSLIRKMNG